MKQYINNTFGTILLADDEQTFLASTSELLRKAGYICDCADNGEDTLKKNSGKDYDLVITDIKMPGNSNLELVREINDRYPAVSVIIITAYPSQQTAVEAIGLRVFAYIVKPFDFNQLLKNADSAIKTSKLSKIVKHTKSCLSQWVNEIDDIEFVMDKSKVDIFEHSINSFLTVNTEKIREIFNNIRFVTHLIGNVNSDAKICSIMQCQKLSELINGITQAIDSIEKTKELFKSKQLGIVREKLEKLLEEKI
jgi:DNA-binding response OmpR family regulator